MTYAMVVTREDGSFYVLYGDWKLKQHRPKDDIFGKVANVNIYRDRRAEWNKTPTQTSPSPS